MKNELTDDTIMPDGRPLFAWRNQIEMQESELTKVRAKIQDTAIFQQMMGVIWESTEDYSRNDWVFRVHKSDAVTAPDFKENLKKYLHLEA